MAKILIIDDDIMICQLLARVCGKMGHDTAYAHSLAQGQVMVSAGPFDLVFLDVRLPDGNGLQAIPMIQQTAAAPEIIIITGEGDPDGAELAIKSGVWDYLEKPLSLESIRLAFTRCLEFREEKKKRKSLKALKRPAIIGDSPQINECLNLVALAATCDAPTLIFGETGTGKELFARAIHDNSPRDKSNFAVVDCAALPESLIESTLFGHKKGAFTGADRDAPGLIDMANGGTLFLDEVGELPVAIQGAFLRVLQERCFRPVGGSRESRSDFRLVAATNRDLQSMTVTGAFRQDLLFRLQAITIRLPPLRERAGDIKKLAQHFITTYCDRYAIATKGLSPELLEALTSGYHWPGNVRELDHVIANAISAAGSSPTLFPGHLPTYLRIQAVRRAITGRQPPPVAISRPENNDEFAVSGPLADYREAAVSEAEKRYLRGLMAGTRWQIKEACRLSGLSRPRLYSLLKKYGINRQ